MGMGLCMLLACGQQRGVDYSTDIVAITAISDDRAKAFNEGDATGIARHFTKDAYLMVPGWKTQRGQQAIEAYYQAVFDVFHTELESGYEEVKVDGDLAYGRGFAKVILTPKDGGKESTSTAKYLNILERQKDGTWKTTHDIWNGNE